MRHKEGSDTASSTDTGQPARISEAKASSSQPQRQLALGKLGVAHGMLQLLGESAESSYVSYQLVRKLLFAGL